MRKPNLCDHCRKPLGAARLTVNDPNGVSGQFHVVENCYTAACEAKRAVSLPAARLHGDLETLYRVE
jgi:hypothetical protein